MTLSFLCTFQTVIVNFWHDLFRIVGEIFYSYIGLRSPHIGDQFRHQRPLLACRYRDTHDPRSAPRQFLDVGLDGLFI